MPFEPGDRVELTRDVEGVPQGARGKVTSTGFLGGCDIAFDDGRRLTDVSPEVLTHAPAGASSGGSGCAVVALAALGALGAVVTAAARGRWGV